MIARFATWAWLVIVFLALFETVTAGAVVGGALVAGLLLVLFRPAARTGQTVRVRPLALLRYVGHFTVRLVQANIQVGWIVLVPPRGGVRRGIVAVPVVPASDTVLSLLAISISLTPGTSIIDSRQDPTVLYVHVLRLTSVDRVRADVLGMERRLVEALGPADAIEEIDQRLRALPAGATGTGTDR